MPDLPPLNLPPLDLPPLSMPKFSVGLDDGVYHEAPALNASTMGALLDCPALAIARLFSPTEPTEAMRLGTLVHCMVLEPDKVERRYAVLTEKGTTKAGKAQKAEAEEKGLTAVSRSTYEQAQKMAEAVKGHPAVAKLLALDGYSEMSLFWRRNVFGSDTPIDCKGRIDRLAKVSDTVRIALDLKTSITANPAAIGKKIAEYGYHRQAAWYLEGLRAVGLEASSFVFVFVRNSPPYLVTPLVLTEEAIRQGERECDRCAEIWAECIASGVWPAYSEEIVTVDLPPWVYK